MKPIQALSDEDLVSYYKDTNDMDCLGILYKRYSHLVLGVCVKVLKDEQLALDLTMHIFEKLAHGLLNTVVDNFNKWIYTVTKNECVSNIRRIRSEKKYVTGWKEDISEPVVEDEFYNNTHNIEVVEDRLVHAMKMLSPEQETCIRLFFISEQSYKEISISTGFTEALVKSHLQNGKRNLRLFLT